MRLMQVKSGRGGRQVVVSDAGASWILGGYASVYELALKAIKQHKLELVRFSFVDQHGILRGKTLVAADEDL